MIATFDDLKEALYLMEGSNPNIGVNPHLLEWFEKIFLPLYHSKGNLKASGVDKHGEQVTETHVGVTTDEIIAKIAKEENKNHSSKEVLERYLYPLQNQAL